MRRYCMPLICLVLAVMLLVVSVISIIMGKDIDNTSPTCIVLSSIGIIWFTVEIINIKYNIFGKLFKEIK